MNLRLFCQNPSVNKGNEVFLTLFLVFNEIKQNVNNRKRLRYHSVTVVFSWNLQFLSTTPKDIENAFMQLAINYMHKINNLLCEWQTKIKRFNVI